jgi:DNA-binding transcriptional regulator GbsR (MarR family)
MTNTHQLSKDILQFIEEFGLFFNEVGLPRSVGRVLGLLLICEPSHQSAEQIQEKLQLSSGSVSTAISVLSRMGIVKRTAETGSRRLYYELDPDCWQKVIQIRLQQVKRGEQIAENGLRLSEDNMRLIGMRDLYVRFEELLSHWF